MKLPSIIPAWVWLVLIIVAFLAGLLVGFNAGENSVKADELDRVGKEITHQAVRDNAASGLGVDTRGEQAKAAATSQSAASAAEGVIHVIYQNPAVAPADCTPAPGVRVEIDKAYDRAARAVRDAAGLPAAEVSGRRDLPRDGG